MSERGKPWAKGRYSLAELNLEKSAWRDQQSNKNKHTCSIRNVGYEGISNMCLKSTESAKMREINVLLAVVFL